MKNSIKAISFPIIAIILILVVYACVQSQSKVAKAYMENVITALNTQNCTSLYPLNHIKGSTNGALCPRGDAGNFMVIDKVSYQLDSLLGSGLSRQALVKVCIDARGLAAWNVGTYSECSTDPTIINLKFNGLSWVMDTKDFTDISNLISKSGSHPQNYDEFERLACNPPTRPNCTNAVGDDIIYSIKTHQFVQTGVAH